MNQRIGTVLLALLLLLVAALPMGAAAQETAVTVTDMMGREVSLPAPATRIVALTAADCEIVCALGAGDALVGRGAYCDYPESILDLPVAESGFETNVEQIIALEPQVVLMASMNQSPEVVEALENAGIAVAVSEAQDLEGVYTSIGIVGAITGKTAEAEALIREMQATFADVAAKSQNTGKTVYFEVSPLAYGLWAAGQNTFMDELAAMCGLQNAFADVDGWAEVSEEQVLARDPDYIVTIGMDFGQGPTPVEEIMSRAGWENLKAIQNGHVFNADSDEISRPGPRLKNAAEALHNFVNDAAAQEPAA